MTELFRAITDRCKSIRYIEGSESAYCIESIAHHYTDYKMSMKICTKYTCPIFKNLNIEEELNREKTD